MKFDLTIINDVSTIDNIGQFSIAIGNLIKGDSGKSPYIDETTKTWWEYNDTTKEYEDTGIAAKSVDVYNITNEIPLGAGLFYTLSTAITATPIANRKKGLILMFESEAGVWETYQFKGVIGDWSVLGSWSNDLSLKIDKTSITQELGISKTKVMSQKAVTDELAQLSGNIFYHVDFYTSLGYINRSNGLVVPSSIYKVTPFMKLGTEPIYISNAYNSASSVGAPAVSFFGADKNYLGEFPVEVTGTISDINIPVSSFPAGAVYFRTNASTSVYPVITGSSKVMNFINEIQSSYDTPFEKGDLFVLNNANKGILNVNITSSKYDINKKYRVKFAGVNTFISEGVYRTYFGIIAIGDTYPPNGVEFGIGTTSGYAGFSYDSIQTGVKRLPLYDQDLLEVGYVDIDFDKMQQGYYTDNTDDTIGILRTTCFGLFKQGGEYDPFKVDNYPFEKGVSYLKDSNTNGAIKTLQITADAVDSSKQYYLQYFGFNRLFENGKYRHYFGVTDVDLSAVSSFSVGLGANVLDGPYLETDEVLPLEITKFPLFKKGTNTVVGYLVVDVSEAPQGTYFTGTPTNALLRQSIFNMIGGSGVDAPIPTSHRLLLPNDIYFLDEDKVPIYMRSIVSNETLLDSMKLYVGKIDTNFPFLKRVWENIEILPSDFDTSLRIASKYGETYAQEIIGYYKDLSVHKTKTSDLTGKTATVILSGDSITDYDISGYVNKKFLDKGITLSFQGTVSDNISGVVTNNEGRASWEYRNFFGKYTGMNGTAPIYPQPTGDTSTRWLNPFIHIATPAEITAHPEWCFENHPALDETAVSNEKNYTESQAAGGYTGDYYTVSIIDYVANHGITVGDKFIWISNWGFNDLNHWAGSEAIIQDALMGIEILATRLREYADANPTKQVILGISPLLIVQIFNKWDRFSSYLERAIIKAKALNTSLGGGNFKIDLVPVWMSVDRSFGWNYPVSGSNVNQLSDDNDTKYSTPSDTLHPGDFGIHEISNPIVNYIAYNL